MIRLFNPMVFLWLILFLTPSRSKGEKCAGPPELWKQRVDLIAVRSLYTLGTGQKFPNLSLMHPSPEMIKIYGTRSAYGKESLNAHHSNISSVDRPEVIGRKLLK